MSTDTYAMTSQIRNRVLSFGRTLVDQEAARVIVPPKSNESGFWFGGGNLVKGPDGFLYLVGRYRNAGDSRTGLDAGERGLELAIFRSTDGGESFDKVVSFQKSDLDVGERTVLSIEGSALEFVDKGVRLLVSTEKAGIDYPPGLEGFLKPGTGVWTIEELNAPEVDQLKHANIETIIASDVPEYYHAKDPFLMPSANGKRRVGFCSHPFNWSSSNTSIAEEVSPGEWEITYDVLPRGAAWDVAISRGTCVLEVPALGGMADLGTQLIFYDGGECMRPLDEHSNAKKRPRGYSCEELGGLAVITGSDPWSIARASRFEAAFVSPFGTGCSRYVDILMDDAWFYVTWQQSQPDGSQPLVMNKVPRESALRVLE